MRQPRHLADHRFGEARGFLRRTRTNVIFLGASRASTSSWRRCGLRWAFWRRVWSTRTPVSLVFVSASASPSAGSRTVQRAVVLGGPDDALDVVLRLGNGMSSMNSSWSKPGRSDCHRDDAAVARVVGGQRWRHAAEFRERSAKVAMPIRMLISGCVSRDVLNGRCASRRRSGGLCSARSASSPIAPGGRLTSARTSIPAPRAPPSDTGRDSCAAACVK